MSEPAPAMVVSCLSIAWTKRWQRRPYRQLWPLLLAAATIAAPRLLSGPPGPLLSVGAGLALFYTLTRLFVGRGDTASTMHVPAPGTLELTPGEIILRAGRTTERLERASLAGGWLELAHEMTYLVLQMKSGVAVRASVSRQEGESLLEALGLSHDPRAVALRLGSPQPSELGDVGQRALEATLLIAFCLITGLLSLAGILGLIVSPFMHEPLAGAILRGIVITVIFGPITYYLGKRIGERIPPVPTLARIGAEGVELSRLGRRTWIPFTALEAVEHSDVEVHFRLFGGRRVSVKAASYAEARAVVERVRAAQVWATRGSAADRLGQLDRGARTIAEWRSDLGQLAPKAGGYRSAGIDGGELAQVVEDGAAPAERRLAAALAIAAGKEDDSLRRRVRIAAEASANERLRVALLKAVEGELDEAAVEEALDESRERERAVHT